MELLRIRVINQLSMIEAVQSCIKPIASQYEISEKEIGKLNLAIEEAMANVINYGFSQNSEQYFDVAVLVNGNEFDVVVCDKGIPGNFLFDNYNDKLGVRIMQHVLDKLIIKNLGIEGREQHLIKYLTAVPEFESRNQTDEFELPEGAVFDFHLLRREEAIEVARCVYDEFKFKYVHEDVYYPEKFFEACKGGSIYSLVASAPDGEVAGHLAVKKLEDFPGISEIATGVVKKKYRKYSIMKELIKRIINFAESSSDIDALMAEPVAYHQITQKMCIKYGIVPCGFIFGCINKDTSTTYKKGDSLCVAVKALKESGIHSICLPDKLKAFILKIYNSIGIIAKFAEKAKTPKISESIITIKVNHQTNLGNIYVSQTGEDIEQQIKLAVQTLKRENCHVVILYINMLDTAMELCYYAADKQGFFCTGCLPLSGNGDFLIMELFINMVMDYDALDLTPQFTALLEDIKILNSDKNIIQ